MAIEKPPIAVIGMACRFPGGLASPEAYWEFLIRGGEAISEIGPDRWTTDYFFHPDPQTPGKSYTWAAGVLSDIDGFDARFFGISPREAMQVDPQQRILLELAWEALEDAGALPQHLAGSNCGVYVGISNMDYANSRYADPSSGDAYLMTGGVLSIAANRISYFLDLHGPSMAIDTACSSSLVAVHEACESIASGESEMALVGGVNVLLTPHPFIGFSKASMLSPTGKCHAFDASADGYVRAEGGAMLVLKPLEKARADGDPIRAIIVASGTNSDGRTSGISLPNERAQRELLQSVYARAGLKPGELRYIEAHGTGTAVGDPIEANAIGHALAMSRDHDDPLFIGSVKTNIGHLEPAAGVAGMLKVILALEHDVIPPSRNFETPNPNIRFDDLNLRVVTRETPLTRSHSVPAMGVNSFGFGGTNSHVVVRKHQERNSVRHAPNRGISAPLLLSAQSHNGLLDAAHAFKGLLNGNESDLYDVCYTAAHRRQHFEHRLALLGEDKQEITARLNDFINRKTARGIVSGRSLGQPAKLALLFSGNGAQWQGMGSQLLNQDPVFSEWVHRVDALFCPLSGVSIVEELQRAPEDSVYHLTEIAQPALFAVQVGMFESLLSKGLEPGAVFGHSVGEVAAAYASGAYTLEQATRIIYERSKAQAPTRGLGKIAAVGLPAEVVNKEIALLECDLEIGAYNSPSSVTVVGTMAQLEALGEKVIEKGALFRILDLDYPFHSRFMNSLKKDLTTALCGLNAFKTRLPFVSTVTGAVLDSQFLDAEYWWRNVRKPVRLDKAMETLIDDGFHVFLEVSPHAILQGYLRENLTAAGNNGQAVPALKRDQDDHLALAEALCTSHALGCEIDFAKLFPAHGEFVRLPHYPWQRESLWFERTTESFGFLHRKELHPLLGLQVPQVESVWEKEIDLERMPWLGDHVVGGAVVFPAAGFIEMALAASAETSPDTAPAVEYLSISAPLVINRGVTRRVRLEFTPDDGRFTIKSRPRLSSDSWITHVSGRLTRGAILAYNEEINTNKIIPTTRIDADCIYRRAAAIGLEYGGAFRKLEYVDCGPEFALARINDAEDQHDPSGRNSFHLHPARLDACFHGLIGLAQVELEDDSSAAFVPVRIGRITYTGRGANFQFARIRITNVRPRSVTASFELLNDSAQPVAVLKDVRFRRLQLTHDARQTLPVYENVALRHFPKSLDRAGAMPPLKSLARVGEVSLASRSALSHREAYVRHGLPAIEKLVTDFSAVTIGAGVDDGEWISRNQLAATLEVCNAQRPWFNQLLKLLEDAAFIERNNGQVRFSRMPSFEAVKNDWKNLLAEFPAYHAELTLVGRCGLHLRDLLTGAVAPDALISGTTLSRLRAAFPGFRCRDGALRELLGYLASAWSDPRPLRILELGLEGDPPDIRLSTEPESEHVVHVYARCRRSVCDDEAEQSADVENADHALNLVPEDSTEPLAVNGFDVVVASHLLHELEDPAAALRSVRQKLAPGGVLLVAEPPSTPVLDFIRGSSPCWWRTSKMSLGYRSSLRNAKEWRESLIEAGFDSIKDLHEQLNDTRGAGFLLIARNNNAVVEPEIEQEQSERSFLLLSDRRGESHCVNLALEKLLRAKGHQVVSVQDSAHYRRISADRFAVNPGEVGDFARVFEILDAEDRPSTDVIHLMGLSFGSDDDATELLEIQDRRCATTARMVQALLAIGHVSDFHTWLITAHAGALDFGDDDAANTLPPIPSQSPLWGLGRVIANEHGDLNCRLVDLLIDGDTENAARLIAAELEQRDDETEVVLTADARYVSRLRRASNATQTMPEATQIGREGGNHREEILQLQTDRPGSLSQLQWKTVLQKPLGPGEIEILPQAIGLNFRDLMFASGLLPEEAIENGYAGATLGMECSGVVLNVRPDVTRFKPGDEVMGFAPSCFSSRVVTGERTMMRKPRNLSFDQAATAPVAFFTIVYALGHLARLQPGERVLIHGAAGGVGIAAIQFAQYLGAEIFATAGSAEKRDFLRLVGIPHVFDSRKLDFADEIIAITNEEGVDVVLNSLSGEALARSLSVLKPFGRFLELGKRDFYENTRIGLRPFRENVSYFGIDADQLLIERPDMSQRVFEEVISLFDAGVFRPLPHRVFPASHATDAFRYMQRSEHIGKIIVAHDKLPMPKHAGAPTDDGYALDAGATYLVTGGLSGFGLSTARWMVERGARCLVLLGRGGARTDEAKAKVRELRELGAAVHVLKADVASYESLNEVFDHIDAELPPLKGLVHSAMVVDDKLVRDLDANRMHRVLAPKLVGAWNLHMLTRNRDLDFLVLYSSATTSFGNPGLGNYVAANIYLESLARLRRSQGLPATTIAWGPISDSGYLARNDAALQALTNFMGSSGLTTKQGFEALERLLKAGTTCGAVLEFDWSAIRRALPTAHVKRYEIFNREPDSRGTDEQPERRARQILEQLPIKEAKAAITDSVVQTVAKIVRLPPDQVDPYASIFELGMDSLMAIEMHMSVNNKLGVNMPIMGLADIPTIAELVEKIIAHEQLGAAEEASGTAQKTQDSDNSTPDWPETELLADTEAEERPAVRAGTGDD